MTWDFWWTKKSLANIVNVDLVKLDLRVFWNKGNILVNKYFHHILLLLAFCILVAIFKKNKWAYFKKNRGIDSSRLNWVAQIFYCLKICIQNLRTRECVKNIVSEKENSDSATPLYTHKFIVIISKFTLDRLPFCLLRQMYRMTFRYSFQSSESRVSCRSPFLFQIFRTPIGLCPEHLLARCKRNSSRIGFLSQASQALFVR